MRKLIQKIGDFFLPDPKLTSFRKLIIKGIVYLCIFFTLCGIDYLYFLFMNKDSILWKIISVPHAAAIIFTGMFFLIVLPGEFGDVYDNTRPFNPDKDRGKKYSLNTVINMIKKNDIIEFKIIVDNQFVNIGASSDYLNSNNSFFDKSYYINDIEFNDIEEFQERVSLFCKKEKLSVYSIDGVRQATKKNKRSRNKKAENK